MSVTGERMFVNMEEGRTVMSAREKTGMSATREITLANTTTIITTTATTTDRMNRVTPDIAAVIQATPGITAVNEVAADITEKEVGVTIGRIGTAVVC